jgi:regulator of RNase E activity RraA
MKKSNQDQTVLELQARWDKIRIANLYDTLDTMGYPNQCLDLNIKPLFPKQHLSGKAVTVQGVADPRLRDETQPDEAIFPKLGSILFPGAVVVVDCGGEFFTGKFGEMTSWELKQHGAKGFVSNSYIRDYLGLEVIPDYVVCAIGTSPIESSKRWRICASNIPISMPGTLTSKVRVNPGDWIVGGPDGVIVVPQEINMEALVKAEELELLEQGMREDLAAGMSFDEAYKKWGRA